MRILGWWFGAVLLAVVPAFPQSYPEVEAVVETVLAKELDTAVKHLPPALAEALAELPAAEKAALAQEFLPAGRLQTDGLKILPPETADVVLSLQEAKREPPVIHEVVLEKRISNGYEAMLRLLLRTRGAEQTTREEGSFQIWLRFEEGEWRVYELEPPYSEGAINLDNPKLLERFRHTPAATQEAAAVGAMRTYISACYAYMQTFPDNGFPTSLDALAVGTSGEPNPEHAGLLDPQLSTPPFERNGYRFEYQLRSSSSARPAFVLLGRPLEFGQPGTRSFYADESGVIRYTEEDREATDADQALR